MSQRVVELLLGRLSTDEQFRKMGATSLSDACSEVGLELPPAKTGLLSPMAISYSSDPCRCINPGLPAEYGVGN